METLDLSADFSSEKVALENMGNSVNNHVKIISQYLDKLKTAWQDSESEDYISNWQTCCEEITSLVNSTISSAESDLDAIVHYLKD